MNSTLLFEKEKQQVRSTFNRKLPVLVPTENFSSSRWMTGDTTENTTIGYNLSLNYILYDRPQSHVETNG
ncbi:MAG: hypothetical protein R3E08_04885 [Thiotrichaceae bacterium]